MGRYLEYEALGVPFSATVKTSPVTRYCAEEQGGGKKLARLFVTTQMTKAVLALAAGPVPGEEDPPSSPNRIIRFPEHHFTPHGPLLSSSSSSSWTWARPPPSSQPHPHILFSTPNFPFLSLTPTLPLPYLTTTSPWSVHGSESRTLLKKKRSCRPSLATKVTRKRSKSAQTRRCLTSFLVFSFLPPRHLADNECPALILQLRPVLP